MHNLSKDNDMLRSKWKEAYPGSIKRSTNPNIIRFVISGDLHDRRLLQTDLIDEAGLSLNELPEGDVFLVERQISSGEYIDGLPYKYIFTVGGNHDSLVEEAFDDEFDHPCPPTDKDGKTLPHGRERNRLNDSEAEKIAETYRSNPAKRRWYLQHEVVTVNIHDKWPLTVFGSPLSQHRRTDGHTFNKERYSTELWEKIKSGVQVVLTHGAMRDNLSEVEIGEQALDRDCIDEKDRGSDFLRAAIFDAEVRFAGSGHNHNAAGSSGLWVNAAAVVSGYDYETMKSAKESTDTEYAEPRVPTIVDWDPVTYVTDIWTVMATCDETRFNVPRWAKSISRLSEEKGDTDESLTKEFLESTDHTASQEDADVYLAERERGSTERKTLKEYIRGLAEGKHAEETAISSR